jgi:hypothetical protein
MNMMKITLATLAGTVLLAAAPAYADNYRGERQSQRGDRFQNRVVVVQRHLPYQAQHRVVVHRPVYMQRRAVVHRPVIVRHQPTVVYRASSSHDVLGGLIVGAVLGAVIASHGGY